MAIDFFISYTAPDRAWAEWIAVELERAGYTTVFAAWDLRPGTDFVRAMHDAISGSDRTIAVLSPAYLRSKFTQAEWQAAFPSDPTGDRRLLPVRVQPVEPRGLLASLVYVDLVDADEATARRRLLTAVEPSRRAAARFPGWPSEAAPSRRSPDGAVRFPNSGPAITNVPERRQHFTGRENELGRLYQQLRAGDETGTMVVVAGPAGVGKTTLVLEYAHRYASDYDVVWWIQAASPDAINAALADLARRMGVPSRRAVHDAIRELSEQLRLRNRWLLIYDDVASTRDVATLPPLSGGGHVLITLRNLGRDETDAPLRLDKLSREESVELLRHRLGARGSRAGLAELSELAEALDDLPLALQMAASHITSTGEGIDNYLGRLQSLDVGLGSEHRPSTDTVRHAVATILMLTVERVQAEAPGALPLLNLLAFLDRPVPRNLPAEHPDAVPQGLAEYVRDQLTYQRQLAALSRNGLVSYDGEGVTVHPLVQMVVRERLSEDERGKWARAAIGLVDAAFPQVPWQLTSWGKSDELLPQVQTVATYAEELQVDQLAAGALVSRASAYLAERGRFALARALAEQALRMTTSALGDDGIDVARRHAQLGRVLQDLGELTAAREHMERALAVGTQAVGPDDPETGALHNDLGTLLHDLGDLLGARIQLEQALAISERSLGPEHPYVGVRRSNLGNVLRDLGDLTGARDQFERALQIGEAALGPDHPDVGMLRGNLGNVLRDLGDLTGARDQFERALQIGEAALGPDHPTIGIRRGNLGNVLRDLGDLTGARDQFERALQIGEAALGPDHPTIGVMRGNLGNVLRDLGDLTGARDQFERALQIGEATFGRNHPQTTTIHRNLARLAAADPGDRPAASTNGTLDV